MSEDTIKKIMDALANHESRLQSLEVTSKKHEKNKDLNPKAPSTKKGKGSTDSLNSLIENGFFVQSRNLTEVQVMLKKKAMNYTKKELSTTLMRLVQKGALERDGEGGKKSPWKYKVI